MILGTSYYGLNQPQVIEIDRYGGNKLIGTYMYGMIYFGYEQITEIVRGLRTLVQEVNYLRTIASEIDYLRTLPVVYN